MTNVVKGRLTAYERVLGSVAKPLEKANQEEEKEVEAPEQSRKEIFFEALESLIHNPVFGFIVLTAVIFNTVVLILLTLPEYAARMSYFFLVLDSFFLGIYMAEAILKIFALGKKYFESGWNILDFFILATSLLDFIVGFLSSSMQAAGGSFFRILRIFRAMRALRALRMLRTITLLENLQVIVNTVLQSISSMTIIFCLMLLFLYMFAVMGRQLYSEASQYYFGDLFKAITTMFQLLTFDNWFSMYDDVNRTENNWHFIIFCIAYTLVEYFIFLNLFMAVLVDNFQNQVKRSETIDIVDAELEEFKKLEEEEPINVGPDQQQKSEWPQGRPVLNYNPDLEDLGHLPLEERILYVQFYNILCSLDYHAYVQKQNYLMLHRLLDKCQDPRLIMNTQAENE